MVYKIPMMVQDLFIPKDILRQIECWNAIDEFVRSSKARLAFISGQTEKKIKIRKIFTLHLHKEK